MSLLSLLPGLHVYLMGPLAHPCHVGYDMYMHLMVDSSPPSEELTVRGWGLSEGHKKHMYVFQCATVPLEQALGSVDVCHTPGEMGDKPGLMMQGTRREEDGPPQGLTCWGLQFRSEM